MLSLWLSLASPGHAQVTREADLKAVLLYNLAQFAEWPASAFASPSSPLVIGIVGRDPFGQVLDDIVADETVHGRRLAIERYPTPGSIGKCHILYIGTTDLSEAEQILVRTRGLPVLTVGEARNFATRGGMVRFFRNEENKIRLQINLDQAEAAGLKISAKLLRVSEVLTAKK